MGARGSAVGQGTTLQAGRWWVQSLMRSLDPSTDPIPWAAPQPWGLTQPSTETNTRNPSGRKEQSVHKANIPTTNREPTVQKMWEPRRLRTLRANMARHRDSFNLYFSLYQMSVNVFWTCPVTYCNVLMNLLLLITWDMHNDIQLALRGPHLWMQYEKIFRYWSHCTVWLESDTGAIYRPFFVSYKLLQLWVYKRALETWRSYLQ
jgi:hypothetical protein